MNYKEAIKELEGLLNAFDRDEHGDYFYDHGWEICEAAILAYGALENQPRWISVEERLPEDDGDYLCYCPVLNIGGKDIPRYEVYGFTLAAESNFDLKMSGNKGAAWYWYDSEYGYCSTRSVTHWMKPPEPPTEEEV